MTNVARSTRWVYDDGSVIPDMHIVDLDSGAECSDSKCKWNGSLTVTLNDERGIPVQGAIVTVEWNDGKKIGIDSCTSTTEGICTITRKVNSKNGQILFNVVDVDRRDYRYTSDANLDVDGDSDGTTMIVYQPVDAELSGAILSTATTIHLPMVSR